MSNIKFKIAAKTDMGMVRKNNEDNLQAACDLTTAPMKWVNDQECDLGNKGALLVVADGMGGMNAGEVASEIAINTVKDYFSPDKIKDNILESKVAIDTFMKKAIQQADQNIKEAAKNNPDTKGMGTTIVIAWLIEDKLYVAWCGDSRAYIYNRINGLRQITKDHSYVQTLVDKGKITHDDAFDYPDSNIITRCLSDATKKARPDTMSEPIIVCNDDIILLCTDGLSGMIRDHEIEQILTENGNNMQECCDRLIAAANEAAGEDNITVALCKIVDGAKEAQRNNKRNKLSSTINFNHKPSAFRKVKKWLIPTLLCIFMFGAGFLGGWKVVPYEQTKPIDSIKVDSLISLINDLNDTISARNDSIRKLNESLNIGNNLTTLGEQVK